MAMIQVGNLRVDKTQVQAIEPEVENKGLGMKDEPTGKTLLYLKHRETPVRVALSPRDVEWALDGYRKPPVHKDEGWYELHDWQGWQLRIRNFNPKTGCDDLWETVMRHNTSDELPTWHNQTYSKLVTAQQTSVGA